MNETISKKYGIFSATSIVVSGVIGIGIFFKTAELLTVTGGNTVIGLIALLVAGFFTIISGLTLAELASNFTESGGDVTYAERMLGKPWAFITGWGTMIVGYPAVAAIIGWVGTSYAITLMGLEGRIWQLPLTLLIVLFCFFLNMFAPKFSGKFNLVVTIIKLIPIFLMAIFGLMSHGEGAGMFASGNTVVHGNLWQIFTAALFPAAFVFAGWKEVATVSGEINQPEKNVPKAIILGLGIIVLAYISLYIGFVNVYPSEVLIQPDMVPFGVAEKFFGPLGSKFIMLGIVISAFGALNSLILVTTRYPYGLAIKNLLPFSDYFAKVSERSETPIRSSMLGLIVTIFHVVCIYFGYDFSATFTVTVYIVLAILFTQMIRLRKQGKMSVGNMYKTKFFPLLPCLSISFSLFLVIGSFLVDQSTSRNMLVAIILYVMGLPLYFFEQYRVRKKTTNNI